MGEDEKIKFLREIISERLAVIGPRANDNRERGFRLRMLVTGLSALTTVLLGLKGFREQATVVLQNSALLASALVSLLTAWDAFFNYRAAWIRFQVTVGRLKELEKDLNYLTAGNEAPEAAKLDELYARFRQIMADHNESWLQLRRSSPTTVAG